MSRPFFLQSYNAGERETGSGYLTMGMAWGERNRISIDEPSRRDLLATPPKWLDPMPIEDGLYSRSPIFRANRPIAGHSMRMHLSKP